MLIVAVTYRIPDDRADEAERMFAELRSASLQEPGCLGYEVMRGLEERSTFVLFERYRDHDAFDAHQRTEHFQRLGVNGIRTFAMSRQPIIGTPVE